tara:strand:+ start:36756 stop:37208 length:453 start_codon:yes stop_codon:yes gene_type:complete
MVNQLKQDIANFFYFSLLNEGVAVEAASKTFSELHRQINVKPEDSVQIIEKSKVIHECSISFKKYFKRAKFGSGVNLEAGWQFNSNVDQGLWRHFVRDADEDEYTAVIWSSILRYPDEDIAKGLGVTVGTVRHRTGRGLRKLGSMWGVQG